MQATADLLPARPIAAGAPPWLAPGRRHSLLGALARCLPVAGRWLLPSLGQLLFLACILAAIKTGSRMVSADGDAARHLTVGEYILTTRAIPHQDVFSDTMAGTPFVPYEWLAEVASAASYRLAGLAGPVLLHGTAIALTFSLLFRHLRRRGHGALLAMFVTVVAAVLSCIHWLARPHIFTFLGAAVFSYVLDGWYARRLSTRWLWVLPLATVVWANTHGGFLIGLILVGAYGAADVLRALCARREMAKPAMQRLWALIPAGLACLGAAMLNPAGPQLLRHVTGYLDMKLLVDNTQEYMSPDFHEVGPKLFALALLGIVASVAWSRRRPALHEGLLLLAFSYFALFSIRNVPLFAIVVAPLLAAQLTGLRVSTEGRAGVVLAWAGQWLRRRDAVYSRMDARARGHVWPVAILTVAVALAVQGRDAGGASLGITFDGTAQPVGAVAHLREHPLSGAMYNELGWGGYLLHELWPAQRVFIDGQTDFYGEALSKEYLDVYRLAPNWRHVLDAHDVEWVIFSTDTPFVRQLAERPEWRVAYQDKTATILARMPAAGDAR